MFDEAYLCEVNLYIISKKLKEAYKAFGQAVMIDPISIYSMTMIEYHYEIALSCHGGY